MLKFFINILKKFLNGFGVETSDVHTRVWFLNPSRVAELSRSPLDIRRSQAEADMEAGRAIKSSYDTAIEDAPSNTDTDELLIKDTLDPGWDKPNEREKIRGWVRTKHDWLEPYSRFNTISKVAYVPGTPEYEAYASIINHWATYQYRFVDPVVQREIAPLYPRLDAYTINLIVTNELGAILDRQSIRSPSPEEIISIQLQRQQKAPNGLNGKREFKGGGTGLGYYEGMDPYEYEHFCARLLKSANWVAEATKGSGDQGVDVLAEKFGFKVALQVKKYAKPAGNGAVQEILAGKLFYEAAFGVVVCTAGFTKSAQALAKKTGIYLMHHDDLRNLETILPSNSYFSKASYDSRK